MLERRKAKHWYQLFTSEAELDVRWCHVDNLEHRHEYNECDCRNESSKECAGQDNIDETKAKETQDEGNQSNLEICERIKEGLMNAYTCLHRQSCGDGKTNGFRVWWGGMRI